MNDRLFIGAYPCGLVYADRDVERAGDYKRLAFLSYSTLQLDIEKDCPKSLVQRIRDHALGFQESKGQQFRVTTAGQTVVLGSACN